MLSSILCEQKMNQTVDTSEANSGRRRHPRGAQRSFFLNAYSSTMHKFLKNGRRDFGYKPIFLYPESISKVDPAQPDLAKP